MTLSEPQPGRVQLSAALGARCKIRSLALIMTRCLNEQGWRHGQGSSGRVQRWCDSDYHHDYGAGVKGAARLRLDGANDSDSKFRKLCFELYLFGDLLEQSPPPFAHRYARGWAHPLGKFLPLVLALANSCCDSLDG